MRTTLFALGMCLLLSYPVLILFAIASKVDQSQGKQRPASITMTPRSTNQWFQPKKRQTHRHRFRQPTIRRSNH